MDLESYRENSKLYIVRITTFVSIFPISRRLTKLVCQCLKVSNSHVFNLEGITLKGFFLGHEGFLKWVIKAKRNKFSFISFKFEWGSNSTCLKINQGTIWAQNGHKKNFAHFYVPKITKVVKISNLEKPSKPLISLQ